MSGFTRRFASATLCAVVIAAGGSAAVIFLLLDVPASLPIAILTLALGAAVLPGPRRPAPRIMALTGVVLSSAVLIRWLGWYLNSD